VVAILALHAAMLGWGAYRHSPTAEEIAYLPAGLSHWQLGRFDLADVSPPLVRIVAAIPVLCARPIYDWKSYEPDAESRSAHAVGVDFIVANGPRAFWLFTLSRLACIPFSLIGGFLCYRWAGDLYGLSAGILALLLWCFNPSILGTGQLKTAS
jgi:hypothetical protein